tara:strand:+ start:51 stop:260 length:210 start_codon:yes stop_codon:yes gene_type:complete
MNKILLLTIVFYIAISLIIWVFKPAIMFNYNGSIKNLGVNDDETIFFYPIILIFLAIFLYIIFFKLFSK